MAGKEGLAATLVREIMMRLAKALDEEVRRFEADPPADPAERIKFISSAANAGRAVVVAETAGLRAERLVEAVGKLNPAGGAEDEDGDGMRDADISAEQFEAIKAGLEQKLLEEAGLERKGRAGPVASCPGESIEDPRLGSRSPAAAPG